MFVSHSHGDHYDPVIFNWKKAVPDISYFVGWRAADDPSYHYLVGPRAELESGGYVMWHSSTQDGAQKVPMTVDVEKRSMQYTTTHRACRLLGGITSARSP